MNKRGREIINRMIETIPERQASKSGGEEVNFIIKSESMKQDRNRTRRMNKTITFISQTHTKKFERRRKTINSSRKFAANNEMREERRERINSARKIITQKEMREKEGERGDLHHLLIQEEWLLFLN